MNDEREHVHLFARNLATSATGPAEAGHYERGNVAENAAFEAGKCPNVGDTPESVLFRTFGHFNCRTRCDISGRRERGEGRGEGGGRRARRGVRTKRGAYKFTAAAKARFCSAVEFGMSRARAARHAGVCSRTVERAVKADDKFARQVAVAVAVARRAAAATVANVGRLMECGG